MLVDRVEDDVVGDVTKPFAAEIAAWSPRSARRRCGWRPSSGSASRPCAPDPAAPERDALLNSALRDSGEQALREFVARWQPTETESAVVLYDQRKVATLFLDAAFPVTLMTTRTFAATVSRWGVDADAVAALEAIGDRHDLKPALAGAIDPSVPVDLRTLPAPMARG